MAKKNTFFEKQGLTGPSAHYVQPKTDEKRITWRPNVTHKHTKQRMPACGWDFMGRMSGHDQALFESVFSLIPPEQRHSVSTGPLRYPHQVYTKIKNLYPDDGFMATPLHKGPHYVAYPPELEEQAHARIRSMLSVWIDDARCFHCLKPNVL